MYSNMRRYLSIIALGILVTINQGGANDHDKVTDLKIGILDFLYVCDGGYDPQYSFEKNIEKQILMPSLIREFKNFHFTDFKFQSKQVSYGKLDYFRPSDESKYQNKSQFNDFDLLLWGTVVPIKWPQNYKLNIFLFNTAADEGLSGTKLSLTVSNGKIVKWNNRNCKLRQEMMAMFPAIFGYKLVKLNRTMGKKLPHSEINRKVKELINRSNQKLPSGVLEDILKLNPFGKNQSAIFGSLELNLLQDEYLILNLSQDLYQEIEQINLLSKELNWPLVQRGIVMPEISIINKNSTQPIESAELNDYAKRSVKDEIQIGILPFRNDNRNNRDNWMGFGLEYLIVNKLSAISKLNVLDKDIIETVLIDSGFSINTNDNASLQKVANSTGFNVAIRGRFATGADQIEVGLDYINAIDSVAISSYHYQENLDGFFNIADDIIADFLRLTTTSPLQKEERLINHRVTSSLKAFEYFCMGYLENEKPKKDLNLIIDYFSKAVKKDPRFWEAQYNLGIAYYNNKKYNRALGQFDKLIGIVPNFEKPYLGRGLTYIRLNDYRKAEYDFLTVLKLKPDYYKPYYYLGKIYVSTRQYDLAKNYLKKALDLNPEHGNTYFEIGNLYYAQHKFSFARSYYNKAVQFNPGSIEAHQKLGECLYHRHSFKEAINEFEKVLEVYPNDSETNFMLGITIYKQAVLDEYIDAFLEMFSINMPDKKNPNNANIALQRKRINLYNEMITLFQRANSGRQNFYEATFNLALTYQEMGEIDSAFVYYDKTIAINPKLAKAHLMLIKLYEAEGEEEKALESYKSILRTEPSYFATYPNLGEAYDYINIVDVVIGELEQEIREDPHDVEANLSLARIFHAQGYYGKAANIYRKILKIAPDHERAKQMLAQLEK